MRQTVNIDDSIGHISIHQAGNGIRSQKFVYLFDIITN